MINTDEYTEFVEGKIITEGKDRLFENFIGLTEELGEVASLVKRYLRDGTPISKDKLKAELGDVTFYTVAFGNCFDISLTDIINSNVEKLNSRAARGKIKGSGDNR
jgi:NTP pyrophosphatase (non-canonical NTP hydrolase)